MFNLLRLLYKDSEMNILVYKIFFNGYRIYVDIMTGVKLS